MARRRTVNINRKTHDPMLDPGAAMSTKRNRMPHTKGTQTIMMHMKPRTRKRKR